MSVQRTPYKMYHPAEQVTALDTHGQSWRGEAVQENIDLCQYQLIEPVFRTYLPKTGRILESGSGIGRWVFYLLKLGYDIIGIDIAEDVFRIVREYDPNAPIYAEDILHSSYADRSFAAVISLGVLEHFEEGPQAGLREAHRLLSDDGLFFVSVPLQNASRLTLANRLKALKRRLREAKGAAYVFEEYRYTRAEFEALLSESRFDIIAVTPDDFTPPKNIGLYVDYPFLRHATRKWELNIFGRALFALLNAVSPWICTGGILWVCRKKP